MGPLALLDAAPRGRQGPQQLPVDWQSLQRPGFSPDYIESRYETIDLAYERADWIPTVAAQTLMRNNRPLLAYIAGKPAAFHEQGPQLLSGRDRREAAHRDQQFARDRPVRLRVVVAACRHDCPALVQISVPTGQQDRTALHFELPDQLAPGRYELQRDVPLQHR